MSHSLLKIHCFFCTVRLSVCHISFSPNYFISFPSTSFKVQSTGVLIEQKKTHCFCGQLAKNQSHRPIKRKRFSLNNWRSISSTDSSFIGWLSLFQLFKSQWVKGQGNWGLECKNNFCLISRVPYHPQFSSCSCWINVRCCGPRKSLPFSLGRPLAFCFIYLCAFV